MAEGSAAPTVVAVIVTHDRPAVLRETVASVLAQTYPVERIVIVDSGSPGGADRTIGELSPVIELIEEPDNVGVAGGLAIGITAASATEPSYYWLLDDDSPVGEASLARALRVAAGVDGLGLLGNRGGSYRRGAIVHRYPTAPPRPEVVDFCLLDGALLSAWAVTRCGVPRADFFMMHQDVEYPLRLAHAGLQVVVCDAVESVPMYLGSTPDAGRRRYWRAYYQSRNHLRMALDARSPLGVWGWLLRELKIVVAGFGSGGGGWTKARLVARGAFDAALGRMGRRVEPGSV